ncbi:hypothetical protein [Pseudomonas putida]|uniref:hypothetical protein n=1 Tax=Pseudomonas putida TaxID=303 RepID=UPI001E62BB69|nr:hypothetical protein [Pseudomonas putida]MCC9005554.1 hypothetical protein [Pseudomonas putida]
MSNLLQIDFVMDTKMNFIELPPAPNERQLTAKASCENLEEHKALFLAANNNKEWTEEEKIILSEKTIAAKILECASSEGLFFGQLKNRSNRIYKDIRKTGRKMKLHRVYDILPRALGYRDYVSAYQLRTADDFVHNLWPSEMKRGEEFLTMNNIEQWPSDRKCDEFDRARALNRTKTKVRKSKKAADNRRRTIEYFAARRQIVMIGKEES